MEGMILVWMGPIKNGLLFNLLSIYGIGYFIQRNEKWGSGGV